MQNKRVKVHLILIFSVNLNPQPAQICTSSPIQVRAQIEKKIKIKNKFSKNNLGKVINLGILCTSRISGQNRKLLFLKTYNLNMGSQFEKTWYFFFPLKSC
eukprot:TRINITY_DN68573_c0_g1_i1.p2 TRINITY_DN68573_c0_g1~~TRINITY_DN68573_c0_g1_i1.p2  ORF type:complete len:101 (+),score=5.91 TRINITY_DN68573_c0_g1_i1:1-303(+)